MTGGFGTAKYLGVVTHHKTGTIWLRDICRQIGRHLGLRVKFAGQDGRAARHLYDAPDRAIFLSGFGRLPDSLWARDDVVILHMIRDPRDVLISGMRYHMTCPKSREPFLHHPRPDLNGASYQEHLNGLADDEQRYVFEMGMKFRQTIEQMVAWPFGRPNVVEWKYEDLITDDSCDAFAEALRPFARDAGELELMRQAAWDNSIFGGLADPARREVPGHINAGTARQWRTGLPPRIAAEFLARHGDDLIALGYESDKSWLSDLVPPAGQEAEYAAIRADAEAGRLPRLSLADPQPNLDIALPGGTPRNAVAMRRAARRARRLAEAPDQPAAVKAGRRDRRSRAPEAGAGDLPAHAN